MIKKAALIGQYIYSVATQQCSQSDPQKIDCGYLGIDQAKCEGKGCCWKPEQGMLQNNFSKMKMGLPGAFILLVQMHVINLTGMDLKVQDLIMIFTQKLVCSMADYGRYPGDVYAGRKSLTSFNSGRGKNFLPSNNFQTQQGKLAWASLLDIKKNSTKQQFAQTLTSAGDAIMFRLYKYVKNDGGHINQQIEKSTGKQTAAHDMTWSYANILSALKTRKTAIQNLHQSKNKL